DRIAVSGRSVSEAAICIRCFNQINNFAVRR
ncbi:hypothetical protein D034_1574B, partial [Vibrio parahaemolyticus Peru-288]